MNADQLLTLIQETVGNLGYTNSDKIQLSSPLGEKSIESNPTEPIGIDSLDLYDLAMTLESETNKHIEDKKLQEIKTVGELVEFFKEE